MTSYRDDELTGIGVELRDARLARGVTIEDAQRSTRIARRYLDALEQEDFEALPAPVFARGFLRSYAQYLGLDPSELVARFPGEPRPPQSLPDVSQFETPRRTRRQRLEEDDDYRAVPLEPIPEIDTTSPSVRLGPWLVAGFVVLAVLAGVVAIVAIGDGSEPVGAPVTRTPGVSPGPSAEEAGAAAIPTEPVIRLETMPDLTDRTLSDATVVLRRSGLPFVIVQIFDPNTPVGAVIDQAPDPGASLDAGTAVTLVVSRGAQVTPSDDTPADEAPAQPTAPGAGSGESSGTDDATTPGAATGDG